MNPLPCSGCGAPPMSRPLPVSPWECRSCQKKALAGQAAKGTAPKFAFEFHRRRAVHRGRINTP